MRRRRLAIAFATLIAILALTLGAGVAVLEFAPRDYVLVWRLQHTKRIEVSNPERRSRVIEVTDPAKVAEIVRAMAAKLDRGPREAITELPYQVHFLLDDGAEIVAGLKDLGEHRFFTSWIRSAQGEALRSYATDGDKLQAALWRVTKDCPIVLGPIHCGETEVSLELDFSQPCHAFEQTCFDLTFRCREKLPPREGPPISAKIRFVGRDGVLKEVGSSVESATSIWGLRFGLDEVDSIEVTVGGRTTSLKLPPIRYHEPIVPPCPTCGTEDVLVCLYGWPKDHAAPFRGRCKLIPLELGSGDPLFFCERCGNGF